MNRMTPEKARRVRARGHADARAFARLIGLPEDYQNNPQAKKDVIDKNGDAHSVKSGKLKWQIFLYKKSRFIDDLGFAGMNGIGDLIADCLSCHPATRAEYEADKARWKRELQPRMIALKERLSDPRRRASFFEKAFFNGNEVNYLTILSGGIYHVFAGGDVVQAMRSHARVKNSQARRATEFDEQKVVFFTDSTIGEIELRRDPKHYISAKFWMHKEKTLRLLCDNIAPTESWGGKVAVYGRAIQTFKRKHKDFLTRKS